MARKKITLKEAEQALSRLWGQYDAMEILYDNIEVKYNEVVVSRTAYVASRTAYEEARVRYEKLRGEHETNSGKLYIKLNEAEALVNKLRGTVKK
jgi:hypothetical protein